MTLEEEADALIKATERDIANEMLWAQHKERFAEKRARDKQKLRAKAQFGPRPVKATNGKEGA